MLLAFASSAQPTGFNKCIGYEYIFSKKIRFFYSYFDPIHEGMCITYFIARSP